MLKTDNKNVHLFRVLKTGYMGISEKENRKNEEFIRNNVRLVFKMERRYGSKN